MKVKKVLQIDGGGILGIIPAVALMRLEAEIFRRYGKRLHEVFDLIGGTSTGAMIGGAIAAGVPASVIAKMYTEKAPQLFRPRSQWNPSNWLAPKYDREPFLREILETEDYRGRQVGRRTLGELETRFLATAFNLCSGRTHFLKSWKEKDKHLPLVEVLNWSALSAAHFFGKVEAPDYRWDLYGPDGRKVRTETGAVMQDGGQGMHNSTTGYILHEIMAGRWAEKGKVLVLSLGCGSPPRHVPFEQAADYGYLREIKEFARNQARGESIISQTLVGGYVAAQHPRIDYRRLSVEIAPQENGLDKIEFVDRFFAYGEQLAGELDSRLIATLGRN